MNRLSIVAFIGITTLALAVATPEPAAAQAVPPDRNAFGISFANYSGAPVYSFGASFVANPALDATIGYSFQSTSSTSGSLFGLGVRYHVSVPAPGIDPYLAGGLANESGTLPGLGTLNGAGVFLGAGLNLNIANMFTGYVRANVYSIGGTSNAITDLGVQTRLAPLVSAQVGYISLAGNGALYLGATVQVP